ncbi:MAG TPA: cytochrome c oxidase subunit 3 [Dongiaceae bacterium]|jgi:cytochrome c oxidase subunit 3|nr:cytochrome c oxidase subunit 3 [Dongiaceae bacterium]
MEQTAHKPNHPYHLVDPSPWPLLGAFAGGSLAVGMVFFMHGSSFAVVLPGIALVLATMFFWWRDVIKEAIQGLHTGIVQIGLRYGMALFIASEVMFFAAFFWAYFGAALYPNAAIGNVWPPKGVVTFDPLSFPLLNTLILLTSGTTVTWAHHALREGDRKGMLQGLALTVLLGVLFSCVQAFEYHHAAFGFKDGIYPSVFFMATGFHGFHVLVGTTFLIVCLYRAWKGQFKPDHHFGFEAAAWYWHFVDVVWLFLFVGIYVWGAGPGPYAGH